MKLCCATSLPSSGQTTKFVLSFLILVATAVFALACAEPPETATFNVKDFGARADGVTADEDAFRAAMNAAAAQGGKVYVPSGTYLFTSTLQLVNGARFVGDGPDQSVIVGKEAFGYMMKAMGLSGISISGLGFSSPTYNEDIHGLYISGCDSPRLSDLKMVNLGFGIKTGSGSIGRNYVVERIVTESCGFGLYISHLDGAVWNSMNINAIKIDSFKGVDNHGIYIEREARNMEFNDLVVSGGGGYALHLYAAYGTSGGITFNRTTIDATNGRYPLVVCDAFSNVRFYDTTLINPRSEGYLINWWAPSDVVFDGVIGHGGAQFQGKGSSIGSPKNCFVKNGTYSGSKLGTVSGVTVINVKTGVPAP